MKRTKRDKELKALNALSTRKNRFKIGDIIYPIRGGYFPPGKHNVRKAEIIGESEDKKLWIIRNSRILKKNLEQGFAREHGINKKYPLMFKTREQAEKIKKIMDRRAKRRMEEIDN